ncbi:MAG: proline dehydrogenase [Saprospiraceae bacterium]|jgi:proline dehydrogenase
MGDLEFLIAFARDRKVISNRMSQNNTADIPDFSNTRIAFQSKTDKQLIETARLFRFMNKGWLVDIGTSMGKVAMKLNLPFVKSIIKHTIFKQFCGGVTLSDCQFTIDHLYEHNTLSILDYGAEAKSAAKDLDIARDELLTAIEFAASNNSVPVVSCKLTALIPNHVLEHKQLGSNFSTEDKELYAVFWERINIAAARAVELSVGVFIDAEESWMQTAMDDVVRELMALYNRDQCIIYNTYQLYRQDKFAQLESDHEVARSSGYILGAKLVRGAYMDKEREYAKEKGIASLIQINKEATDKDYNKALLYCLDHYEEIGLCNASHNLQSVQLMAETIHAKELPQHHKHLNFCQLQGMSDHLTFNLAQAGYNTAKYVVYGPVKDVTEYLIRRAEENTAVTGEMSRELHLIETELKRRNL